MLAGPGKGHNAPPETGQEEPARLLGLLAGELDLGSYRKSAGTFLA